MSIRTLLLSLVAPVVLVAQQNEADFVRARQQFLAGQTRQAAQTLVVSSVAVRTQLGRCRDEDVGNGLVEAEAKLEKLAAAVRGGSIGGVKTLDLSLTAIDRVLAKHHLQLAVTASAHPRGNDVAMAAADLTRAAYHFDRSITLTGLKPNAEQTAALDGIATLVKAMESTNAVPKNATDVMTALDTQIAAATAAAKEK